MNKKIISLVLGSISALLLMACGGSAGSMTASQTVTKMFELQKQGDFKAYVEYLDIDDSEVKAQLAEEFKIATEHFDNALGGMLSSKVISEELSEDGTQAKVSANVSYKKNQSQKIVLNMVLVDGQWKLKQL